MVKGGKKKGLMTYINNTFQDLYNCENTFTKFFNPHLLVSIQSLLL